MSGRFAMRVRSSIVSLLVLGLAIAMVPVATTASNELVINGGFESGNAFGWTILGDVSAVRYSHSGIFSLRLGSRFHSGQVSQSFNVSAGVSPTVSFWYLGVPGDMDTGKLIVTLLDQNGAIIAQWNAAIDYRWHQVTYAIDPKYGGSAITLRFYGTPDIAHEVIDWYCPPPPFPCRHRVIAYPVYTYIDDVSVSYG